MSNTFICHSSLPKSVRFTYYFHIFAEGMGALTVLSGATPMELPFPGFGFIMLALAIFGALTLWRPAKLLVPASIAFLLYHLQAIPSVISSMLGTDQPFALIMVSAGIHLILVIGFSWTLFKVYRSK